MQSFFAPTRCVEHDSWHVPNVVLTIYDLLASGQAQPWHSWYPCLYPLAMLLRIGADDFNVHVPRPGVQRDLLPFTPCQLDRVTGIRSHADPRAQNIGGDLVGQPVTLTLHVKRTQISQCLLDPLSPPV